MKLLLDQNLSHKLILRLKSVFSGSNHVFPLGFSEEKDTVIWEYAKKNRFTIVTQDSDFYDKSLIYGHPPKIIWLRLGNVLTNKVNIGNIKPVFV